LSPVPATLRPDADARAQRIHGNARGEIEIALAVGRDQPGTFATLKSEIDPGEYGSRCDVALLFMAITEG